MLNLRHWLDCLKSCSEPFRDVYKCQLYYKLDKKQMWHHAWPISWYILRALYNDDNKPESWIKKSLSILPKGKQWADPVSLTFLLLWGNLIQNLP